jgi:hypothetical protein
VVGTRPFAKESFLLGPRSSITLEVGHVLGEDQQFVRLMAGIGSHAHVRPHREVDLCVAAWRSL